MFRNQFSFPENDIAFLHSKDDCKVCGIELDSVGRPVGAQPVDQFDAQEFMLGENGFRRSDISILMNAQSEDLKRAVAANLTEIRAQFPDQTISDSDLAEMAVPRYAQGYSDLRDWYASLDKSGIAKQVDAFVEAHKPKPTPENKIDFTETSNPE